MRNPRLTKQVLDGLRTIANFIEAGDFLEGDLGDDEGEPLPEVLAALEYIGKLQVTSRRSDG